MDRGTKKHIRMRRTIKDDSDEESYTMQKKVEKLRREAAALGFEIVEDKTNRKGDDETFNTIEKRGRGRPRKRDSLKDCLSLNEKEVNVAATLVSIPTRTESGEERQKIDICRDVAARGGVVNPSHKKGTRERREETEAKERRFDKIAEAARATKRWAAQIAFGAKQRRIEREQKAQKEKTKKGREKGEVSEDEEARRKRYKKMGKPELQDYAEGNGIELRRPLPKGTTRGKYQHQFKTSDMLIKELMDRKDLRK